jgi:dolichol-phosphate mannosyltransferase
MDKPFLSIVIPLYNELGFLENTLREIRHHVGKENLTYEIILIDDGSTDGTWNLISNLSRTYPELRGIKLSRNFGKESAITAGVEFAFGDVAIVMDGDGQHPPELITEMVKRWREGVDIVEAIKEDRGTGHFSTKIGAKLFYWLMRHLTDLNIDKASDFKLLDRKVIDAHNKLPEKIRFFRGIVSWIGFKKVQIPFSVRERVTGESRWSFIHLVKLAVNASTSFSSLPLHLITVMGVITFILSIIIGLQTVYMKFSGAAVSGFTTVILLLLFIGSVLMMSLGIIGIYISRIFDEVKGRPRFIIEDVIHLKGNDP